MTELQSESSRLKRITLKAINICEYILCAISMSALALIIYGFWNWAKEASGWTSDLRADQRNWNTSVYVSMPIKAGALIKADQLFVKRKPTDFPLAEPREVMHVAGRKARTNLAPSFFIKDNDLESDDATLRAELQYSAPPHYGTSVIDMHYLPANMRAVFKRIVDDSEILRQTPTLVEYNQDHRGGSYSLTLSTKTSKKMVEWQGDHCPTKILPLVQFLEQHGELLLG